MVSMVSISSAMAAEGVQEPIHMEMVAEKSQISDGQPFWIALKLRIDDGWHAYWKNAGDIGYPIELEWQLPENLTVTQVEWPYPNKKVSDLGVTYYYDDEIAVLVEITPTSSVPSAVDALPISVNALWLACSEDQCLPGQSHGTLNIKLQKEEPLSLDENPIFETIREKIPKYSEAMEIYLDGQELHISLPSDLINIGSVYFCPEEQGIFEGSAEVHLVFDADKGYEALLTVEPTTVESPGRIAGVLVVEDGGKKEAWQIDASVDGEEIAVTDAVAEAFFAPEPEEQDVPMGVVGAMLLAFVGGAILNLMPCVLPVVSLKILSFVKMAKESRSVIFKHGIAFSAGVILSFWALATLLLVLKSYGQAVGWGFQLQEPIFVALLAALIFVFSLSLFGVFELGTGFASVAGKADVDAAKAKGFFASFFSGVLATAVATPCTGPFLGTAIGFAFTLPPLDTLMIFTALGFGMASPYLLVAAVPSLIRFLPKPGAWMLTFKELLGFVMMLTTLWLLWVFVAQTSSTALFALLFGLFILSIGSWVLGKWASPTTKRHIRRYGYVASILIFAAGLYVVVTSVSLGAAPEMMEDGSLAMGPGAEGFQQAPKPIEQWVPFSVPRAFEIIDSGKPLFVDFTARWCLICQTNHAVLSVSKVEEKMRSLGVVKMVADWTKYDPEITRTLQKYGRNGVPLYLLFGKDPKKPPYVLPQLLSPDVVMEYLEKIEKEDATN